MGHHTWPHVVFNFSDIKLSLLKFFEIINYLTYTPEKTNYNVKNMPLIYGVVRCVADRVWWAALCQKAPASRYWASSTLLSFSGQPVLGCWVIWLWLFKSLGLLPYFISGPWMHQLCCCLCRVRKLSDFISNILICFPKMNEGLTGLEQH